jgi:hypothetical protein
MAEDVDITDDDTDLLRIIKICQNGLKNEREGVNPDDNNFRLDTFAVVCVWAWVDEDGDECEGYSVWSETRRTHVKLGVLSAGIERLIERE